MTGMPPAPRRVVHVVENLQRGGLERVVIDLAADQAAMGHDCMIVCLFEEGQLAPEVSRRGIALVACGKRPGFDARALLAMRRAIASHRPDVVHSHNGMAHTYAMAATVGMRIARVNTRHGMGTHLTSSRGNALYRFAMAYSDAGVAVCDAARQRFVAAGAIPARKALTVHNGIFVDRFQPRSEGAHQALARQLQVDPSVALFGTVARLDAAKDQATLLRAMGLLRDRGCSAALVVAGGGPLRGALDEQAAQLGLQGRVHFLGDRSDVPELLAGLDAFVLSSITEGYSISLLEACAAGLPIIATDVGGNAEIVADGLGGSIVPASDPAALADAMARLAADPALRERMGKHNRGFALTRGSVRAMTLAYESVYAAARARPGPSGGPANFGRRGVS